MKVLNLVFAVTMTFFLTSCGSDSDGGSSSVTSSSYTYTYNTTTCGIAVGTDIATVRATIANTACYPANVNGAYIYTNYSTGKNLYKYVSNEVLTVNPGTSGETTYTSSTDYLTNGVPLTSMNSVVQVSGQKVYVSASYGQTIYVFDFAQPVYSNPVQIYESGNISWQLTQTQAY